MEMMDFLILICLMNDSLELHQYITIPIRSGEREVIRVEQHRSVRLAADIYCRDHGCRYHALIKLGPGNDHSDFCKKQSSYLQFKVIISLELHIEKFKAS